MEVPASLAVATFDKILQRGDIIHFKCTFEDDGTTKNKFAVVLNVTLPDDPILFALASTATAAHESPLYAGVLIRVPVGTYTCFSKPTVFSFRKIHKETLDEMRSQFARKELTRVGKLLQVHLDQANKMIENSVLIEGWRRNRCRVPT